MSGLSHTTWQFKKALNWQWATVNACLNKKINFKRMLLDEELNEVERVSFNKARLSQLVNSQDFKKIRACWNTWIARHNVEGFFLNMGDMLVKNGEPVKARKVYQIVQQIPSYKNWPYRKVLETRIERAEKNVEKFRAPFDRSKSYSVDDVMLINTSISCVVCHQKSNTDLKMDKNFDFNLYKKQKDIYFLKK